MDAKIEEDNSLSERILSDIENIIFNDAELKEFCIVTMDENKNKSPVLYEEHNLGLESWCVKYVYRYLYAELFKTRRLLRRNRVPQQTIKKLNKLLVGALLINPDVTTFWNMRRELVEYGEINLDRELLLAKLVLSNKHKSNEAFAYRKWILNKLIRNINKEEPSAALLLLEKEFSVTEMAAEKSQNNYHAWSHRTWCIQTIISNNKFAQRPEYLSLILGQLDFSIAWINRHISEHTGYHYRQYLCKCILNNANTSAPHEMKYHRFIEIYLGIKTPNCDNVSYLNNLIGKRDNSLNVNHIQDSIRCYNYVYFVIILLTDLFYFIERFNDMFPDHESMWYHRRFIIYHLLKICYEYHGLTWKRHTKLNETYVLNANDVNIINGDFNNFRENYKLQENGEKHPKLLKYELDKIESSHLYKVLVETENRFIKQNTEDKCSNVQKELARRHEKWLKFVLCFNRI